MGKSGKHGEHHRAWLKARWCTPGSSLFPPALPELDRLIPPPLPGPMAVGGLGRESEEWAARVAPAGRDADPSPTGTQGCRKLKEQGHCLRYVPGRLQGQPRFTGLGDVRVNFLTGGRESLRAVERELPHGTAARVRWNRGPQSGGTHAAHHLPSVHLSPPHRSCACNWWSTRVATCESTSVASYLYYLS